MTTETFESLLGEMQSFLGRHVQVEIGSRAPTFLQHDRPPGTEDVHATFSGVCEKAPSEEDSIVFEIGCGELRLAPSLLLSGYWRERNYRRTFEIMGAQPIVVWVTQLPDDEDQPE